MKLELNVKRFNNEDVIATSGDLCTAHPDAKHLYSYNNNGSSMGVDIYNAGSTTRNTGSQYKYSAFDPALDNTSDAYKWYYYDSSTDKYVECNGNHDGYSKVVH